MHIQKCYTWYCIATWAIWVTSIILSVCARIDLGAPNASLFPIALIISKISIIIYFLPLQLILFTLSLMHTIKQKNTDGIVLSISLFIITTVFSLFLIASHVWLTGGV